LVTLPYNLLNISGEQSTENPCVAGSIPAGATLKMPVNDRHFCKYKEKGTKTKVACHPERSEGSIHDSVN
jgi:hypothetical protein